MKQMFIKVTYIGMCMFSKIKYVSGQMYGLKSASVASGRAHVCGW